VEQKNLTDEQQPMDPDLAKATARAAESTRLIAGTASRGWLVRILPIGIVLIALVLFALQKATNLPVLAVIGLNKCDFEDPNGSDKCREKRETYTDQQFAMARGVMLVVLLAVLYFLYDIFREGAGSGLIGSVAKYSPNIAYPRQSMALDVASAQTRIQADTNDATIGFLQGKDIAPPQRPPPPPPAPVNLQASAPPPSAPAPSAPQPAYSAQQPWNAPTESAAGPTSSPDVQSIVRQLGKSPWDD
jgi:hypothetical protein